MSEFFRLCPKCYDSFFDPDKYQKHVSICGTPQASEKSPRGRKPGNKNMLMSESISNETVESVEKTGISTENDEAESSEKTSEIAKTRKFNQR